jgi:type II secretory pathway pseudopilin PulG
MQAGFSLVESVVAFTILVAGLTVFFWQMRQQSAMAQRQRQQIIALEAAQSDIESLQAMPSEWVHDTTYILPRVGLQTLRLVRTVYDTVDFENSGEELKLDAQLNPLALKEPLEVQVKVYRVTEQGELMSDGLGSNLASLFDGGSWGGSGFGFASEATGPKPLVSITARLPQYLP